MDYKINGRIFEGDEKEILDNMKEFSISREDAVRMYFEDCGLVDAGKGTTITPLETEVKKKRRYEKSDKPRKPSTRERKIDHDKKVILEKVAAALESWGIENLEVKNEVEISFRKCGATYALKLIKHREGKKKEKK